MPYILEADRQTFNKFLDPLFDVYGNTMSVGQLNYVITYVCRQWLAHYSGPEPVGYTQYNAVIGALQCAQLEFYRRAVARYEEGKICENGDVY